MLEGWVGVGDQLVSYLEGIGYLLWCGESW